MPQPKILIIGAASGISRAAPEIATKSCELVLLQAASGAMATPLGRYASAKEIAAQIAFLLSEDAATITGAALTSDGGYSL